MDQMTALIVLAVLIGAVTVALTRLITHDRPANPPGSTRDDWRGDALAWRHLGIR